MELDVNKISLSPLVAITGLAGVLYMSSALAHLAYSYDLIYYSDATMTVQVGDKFVACNGHATVNGTVTAYYQKTEEAACGDGGYECAPSNYVCFSSVYDRQVAPRAHPLPKLHAETVRSSS
jgi:hypothetical protein